MEEIKKGLLVYKGYGTGDEIMGLFFPQMDIVIGLYILKQDSHMVKYLFPNS